MVPADECRTQTHRRIESREERLDIFPDFDSKEAVILALAQHRCECPPSAPLLHSALELPLRKAPELQVKHTPTT